MKSIISGLLGVAERGLLHSSVGESLLAGNNAAVVVGDTERIARFREWVDLAAPAAASGTIGRRGAARVLRALANDGRVERSGGVAGEGHAATDEHGDADGHEHGEADGHEHVDGICVRPRVEEALASDGPADVVLGAAPLPLDQTFRLQSNPGASKVIYLDFTGHTTTGTGWNDATMGSSFYSPAFDFDGNASGFSVTELTIIQAAWQRVADDFAPFDVNVTTLEPPADWLVKSNSSDVNYGIRAVISSYGPASSYAGGIAEVGSFNFNVDSPVFVYSRTTVAAVSGGISHEVGHALGLSHDGTTSGVTYYNGHGTGETGWSPIMGTHNRNVSTWDDGSYSGSNNTGSSGNFGAGGGDLEVITSQNGFGYRKDQVGNSLSSAAPLAISSGAVAQFGTIETRLDTDWFSFQLTASGDLNLNFDPYWYRASVDEDGVWGGASSTVLGRTVDTDSMTGYVEQGSNLDLAVELYDGQGRLLASANDPGLAARLFVQGLSAGSYYLKLDGVGFGNPTAATPTGYSDYASIGNYWISGTISSAADPVPTPVITMALASTSVLEDGSTNLVYTFTRSLVTADPLTVGFTVSGSATNGSDYSGLVAGSSQSVTFAGGASSATVVIDPTADSTVESNETVSLTLAGGAGYILGTVDAVTGTISNDDVSTTTTTTPTSSALTLAFTAATDSLTGSSTGDRFVMNRLGDALWGSTPDRITNLQAGVDTIDSPVARSTAITARQLGAVQTLTAAGISTVLTSKAFVKNGAATFTFGTGASQRTFLALNDGFAGFNASSDSVLEITGFSGSLGSLAIL